MAPLQIDAETISYEEFLNYYEGVRAEWVAGKVVPMTPVSPRHQRITQFLTSLFQHFCEARDAGIVLSAPVQMKVDESAREPDVMVIARGHEERIQPTYLEGPADLVVEIISPESRGRDRGEKFYEYEQGGVREYWMIDPIREQAEFYGLTESGIYQPLAIGGGGRFESRVLPGFWMEVDWLWQEPLPPLMSVLREWKLV